MGKKRRSDREKLRDGLEALAFGSVTDAVELLFAENIDRETLQGMNLFNVAEIRRPKGGGMEIKFADRLKALQCLEQLAQEEQAPERTVYDALMESVAALQEEESCS